MFWSAGCPLLRAEGFFCSLRVLYKGPSISKMQFSIQNFFTNITAVNFFPIFGHQNPEFGTGSGSESAFRKNAGSGSGFYQCGSTTLLNPSWKSKNTFHRACSQSGGPCRQTWCPWMRRWRRCRRPRARTGCARSVPVHIWNEQEKKLPVRLTAHVFKRQGTATNGTNQYLRHFGTDPNADPDPRIRTSV